MRFIIDEFGIMNDDLKKNLITVNYKINKINK